MVHSVAIVTKMAANIPKNNIFPTLSYFRMAELVGVNEIVLSINSSVSMNEPPFQKNIHI